MSDDRRVSDVGEWGLIELIRDRLPPAPENELWSGDDAAVLGRSSDALVFTTDVIVEAMDFDFSYCPPDTVGAKAVAVNASDVAAMGARPRWALATLTVPPDTRVEVVDAIAVGMAEEARSIGVGLVGGDISEGGDLSLSVAMIGVLKGRAITRSGARTGDLICVTGTLGGAAGGLMLLRAGGLDNESAERLAARQLRPRARTIEGPLLAEHGATAMIDVSDGLLADLIHVLDASEVGCELDPASIPVDPDLAAAGLPQEAEPLELALTGGEDFELIFTLPPSEEEQMGRALAEAGASWSVIGRIVTSGRHIGDRNLDQWKDKGWEHLQRR